MASGITVTSSPDPAQLESLGVTNWPTWGCEVSTFPWTYDEQETCLLLESTWMAHLLISSNELLHNLLIDTAKRPQRINAPG